MTTGSGWWLWMFPLESSFTHMTRLLSSSVLPSDSVTASIDWRRYANCWAYQVLICTSDACEGASVSASCDSVWCPVLMLSHGMGMSLTECDHWSEAMRV